MRYLYTVLLYLAAPLLLPWLYLRERRLVQEPGRWRERFGRVARIEGGVDLWIHAVSVGEARAADPLIRALLERRPGMRLLVTTTTPTGSAHVRQTWAGRVHHCYMPWDLPHAVRRFLQRAAPRAVVIMETELWPNLYRALRARDVPLVVANARLSPRSVRGYSRVRSLAASVLGDVTTVAAQSEDDGARFRALGAAQVQVMGNIKFEIAVPQEQVERGQALRARLGADRPVWVAASTHEGEEMDALDAHRELLQRVPDAALILVPRHPQRFDGVWRLVERSGLRAWRRSAGEPGADVQVLLGDSMGEMFCYLAAADLAFVGGSLVPIGGHNVLEPAALGLPVIFGPHMFNFDEARRLLLQRNAAVQIAHAAALGHELAELLAAPERRQRMGRAGKSAVAASRGTLQRLLAIVDERLPVAPAPAAIERAATADD